MSARTSASYRESRCFTFTDTPLDTKPHPLTKRHWGSPTRLRVAPLHAGFTPMPLGWAVGRAVEVREVSVEVVGGGGAVVGDGVVRVGGETSLHGAMVSFPAVGIRAPAYASH
jgi:hypothetical protein